MTFPSVILGTLIGALIGCAFHFWRGGGLKWLALYNLLAIVGFWVGNILGSLFKSTFLLVGPIHLGMSLLGALILLFGGYWLSMASVEKPGKH